MTSEVGPAPWRARYPDLAGKVAVVSGDHVAVVEVVSALAATGTAVAVVAPARETVDAASAAAEAHDVAVFGVVADPAVAGTWSRVTAHAEQRLGPLDVAVVLGLDVDRHAAVRAIAPDMGARRRGVIVEVGEPGELLPLPAGVRRRVVATVGEVTPAAIAAAVALCASDVLTCPVAEIRLGGS